MECGYWNMADKITSFEDLEVWRESQDLAVQVYKITKSFPKDEIFAMTNQIRRAVTSVSANIAEGFGRASTNDKIHFYTMAYGSLLEVKNFFYLAEKLEYIDAVTLEKTLIRITSCQKLINAFKSGLRT